MNTPTKAEIKDVLERVIANAKSYICTRPFDQYKQNELDCLALRAYIEQNSPATSDAAICSGTNAVLSSQDGQESAPDRGGIIEA